MTTADGSVIGTTQIFGSAPANHAFNVVLLAEGFTTAQQPAFDIACATFLTAFRATPPYDELLPRHQCLQGQRQLNRRRRR